MRPEFVDNRNGNTLAEAIRSHLMWLRRTYAMPVELSIATGYFNPEGFSLIADELEQLAGVRLLLGAEPTPPQQDRSGSRESPEERGTKRNSYTRHYKPIRRGW